jgi:hypothetical protein
MTDGNTAFLSYVINTQNILSCRPKENYPLSNSRHKQESNIEKINIVYGAIISERHPAI